METSSSISQCQECYLYGWTLEQKHTSVIKVEHVFFSTLYFLYHALIYMMERAVKYISDGPAIRKSHLLRMQSDDCDSVTSALDLTSQNVDSS